MADMMECVEEMAAALKECADDLEAELVDQYGERLRPVQQRRLDRDMAPVVRARAALARYEASK